jgi:hypothetical protein
MMDEHLTKVADKLLKKYKSKCSVIYSEMTNEFDYFCQENQIELGYVDLKGPFKFKIDETNLEEKYKIETFQKQAGGRAGAKLTLLSKTLQSDLIVEILKTWENIDMTPGVAIRASKEIIGRYLDKSRTDKFYDKNRPHSDRSKMNTDDEMKNLFDINCENAKTIIRYFDSQKKPIRQASILVEKKKWNERYEDFLNNKKNVRQFLRN